MSETPTPTADELLAHADWVRRLAGVLIRDPDDAGDLAQETLEVAIRTPPKQPGPLRPWLGGVARNLARNRRRSAARREQREARSTELSAEVPSPEQLVERVELQQLVARCVVELAEPFRTTLILRYYEGLSAAEIARRTGDPDGTVRWRLKRGLEQVRTSLDRAHDGNRKRWAVMLAPLAGGGDAAAAAGAGVGASLVKGAILMKTGWKLAALAALIAAALFASHRAGLFGGSDDEPPATETATAPTKPSAVAPPAPRVVASERATHEDDPVGTLRLEGQVIDDDEQPVGGARVAIDSHPPRVITAEADGSFAFSELIGRDYQLEAQSGAGYAGPVRLRLTGDSEPVILRLKPAGTVQIEVVDAVSGDPIAGAEVELRSSLSWTATTGDDGVAELAGVPTGNLPLHVRADGYAPIAREIQPRVGSEESWRQRVGLHRGAPVAGVVVDDSGAPIAGARVIAHATSEPFPVTDPRRDGVVTDNKGRWRLPAVAPGSHRFVAHASGYGPGSSAPLALDGATARDGVEIELAAGARVTGVVVDETGAPVAAADVRVVAGGSEVSRVTRIAYTDKDGRFSVGGMPRRKADVVASHATGTSPVTPVDLVASATAEVELALTVRGVLAGVVVDGDGVEIPEAQVHAEPEWTGAVEERNAWQVRGEVYRVSDAGGAFRFVGLPEGRYRLRAVRPGGPLASFWMTPGQVVETGATDLRIVVPADGRVKGRVAFADGASPELFTVAIGPTAPVPFASEDGAFELDAPGGEHRVTIAGPGLVQKAVSAEIADGTTDLGTITVERGRSVSGRVLDASGAPVEGALVAAGALLTGDGAQLYIATESINARTTETDAEGRFSMSGFDEGPITIVAGAEKVGRSESIQLPRGPSSVDVDLVLQATGSLAGKVTRDGTPLADTVIIANPLGATASNFFVMTGPDGSFALDQLTAGGYVVYPMIGGGGPRPKDMHIRRVEVTAGERTEVDIPVETGPVELTIEVVTPKGKPVTAAQLFLIGMSVDLVTAMAMRDGSWLQSPPDDGKPIPLYIRNSFGEPTPIAGLVPRDYSACAIALPGDPRNPLVAVSLRDKLESLPLACKQLEVTASPAAQTVRIVTEDPAVEPTK